VLNTSLIQKLLDSAICNASSQLREPTNMSATDVDIWNSSLTTEIEENVLHLDTLSHFV
jgi:hypothetical protein